MSPREAEAVAVAADALDGAGDPATLVVALVAELARRGRLPENERAVVLAGLIEGHPEGVGVVRMATAHRRSTRTLRTLWGGWKGSAEPREGSAGWYVMSGLHQSQVTYDTLEAAEAALIAAQPEPRAVVRRQR